MESRNETRNFSLRNENHDLPVQIRIQSASRQDQNQSDIKNRPEITPGQTGLSDFQKAYVRKIQREREQELVGQALRSFYAQEDYSDKKNLKDDNMRQSGNSTFVRDNIAAQEPYSDVSSARTGKKQRGISADNMSNLDQIEDKIHDLERNLEKYSKKLQASIERQQNLFGKDNKASSRREGKSKRTTKQHKITGMEYNNEKTTSKEKGKKDGEAMDKRKDKKESLVRKERGSSHENVESKLKKSGKPLDQKQDSNIDIYREDLKNELEQLR